MGWSSVSVLDDLSVRLRAPHTKVQSSTKRILKFTTKSFCSHSGDDCDQNLITLWSTCHASLHQGRVFCEGLLLNFLDAKVRFALSWSQDRPLTVQEIAQLNTFDWAL